MDYIVASTVVSDQIRLADGRVLPPLAGGAGIYALAGGAGIYALAGMKLWTDSVELVTGTGADHRDLFGAWFKNNGLSMDGMLIREAKTPRTDIHYFEDGEREEIPVYGLDHYHNIEVTARELIPYFQTAKGIYIFCNSDPGFWDEILLVREQGKARVMWELAADAASMEKQEQVKAIAEQMDIFSLNLTEAQQLLGVTGPEEVTDRLLQWKVPLIFLRRGKAGAVMISQGEVVKVPSVPGIQVVDPTGGGNSSSGAVLCGYCEGREPFTCGYMGSLSAAMCIAQYSVPEQITKAMRENAQRKLEEAYVK